MKSIAIVLGAAAGLGLLFALTSENEESEPTLPPIEPMTDTEVLALTGPYQKYRSFVSGALGGGAQRPSVGSTYYIDDRTIVKNGAPALADKISPQHAAVMIAVQNHAKQVMALRYAKVAPFVTSKESDGYRVAYQGPWVGFLNWNGVAFQWIEVNRYGLPKGSADGGIDALGLLSTVSGYVLPLIPGIGTAANVALQTAIALGRGESFEDAALAGIRGALPPWGQVAFDLGVGVVLQDKSIDEAAIDAGLNQLEMQYPGARQAYEDGKQTAKDLGL